MNLSGQGVAALKLSEGFRLTAYADSAGKITIGIGHLIKPDEHLSGNIVIAGQQVAWERGLTKDQVLVLCRQDIAVFEKVIQILVKVPLKQCQFDSLINFIFNIGVVDFQKSTLLKVLNDGDYNLVPSYLCLFIYCNHKIVEGLRERRHREALMWAGTYPAL